MQKSKSNIPKYEEIFVVTWWFCFLVCFPFKYSQPHFSGQLQKLLTHDSLHHSLLKALAKHAKVSISLKPTRTSAVQCSPLNCERRKRNRQMT